MKLKITLLSILVSGFSIGQIIPTAGGQGSNSIEYWSRSGNNQNGSNNNIFGLTEKWESHNAQIHFYDGQGKLINSVEITNRGAGQLNVFAEDLSSGTYTYTLVADGQIVSTKKMVKE